MIPAALKPFKSAIALKGKRNTRTFQVQHPESPASWQASRVNHRVHVVLHRTSLSKKPLRFPLVAPLVATKLVLTFWEWT